MNHNGNGIVDGKQKKNVKLREEEMDQITIKIKFYQKNSFRLVQEKYFYLS